MKDTYMSYKRWIIIATSLFGAGIILGLVAPANVNNLLLGDITFLEELADFLAPLPKPIVFAVIFINNAITLLLSFIFSPILCLLPILALVSNGWLLALVAAAVVEEKSLGFVLAGLLPHGVIELPALIMGQAAALSFGSAVIIALFRKERRDLLPSLKKNLRYLLIAVALLLPAAIIETYITPLLLT
jgi:stage II sporulation protein M